MSRNICIIGPKGSGKTTYLVALAYYFKYEKNSTRKQQFNIYPFNPSARELVGKAESILNQGLELEPTAVRRGINSVDRFPLYSFCIEIRKLWTRSSQTQLIIRDISGEVFETITISTLVNFNYSESKSFKQKHSE